MKLVRIVLLFGILVLAWALWRSPRGVGESAGGPSGLDLPETENGSGGSSGNEAKPHGTKSNSPPAAPVGLRSARTLAIPGFFKVDANKIKDLLKSHTDDTQLLSSAALWSDDPEIWAALRKKASTDPLAAATLSLAAPTAQERLDSALSLSKSDPSNGLSYLAAAEASYQLGDRQAALEFMKQAGEVSRFDLYADQYAKEQEDILKTSGLDEVQRGVLLSGDPWQRKAISTLGILNELNQKDQDPASAADAAGQMLNVMDRLKAGIGPTMSFSTTQQLSVAEGVILQSLPPDTSMTDDSTARDRARQLGAEQIELGDRKAKVMQLLETSSYDIAKDYYRRAASEGEMEASKWLLGR